MLNFENIGERFVKVVNSDEWKELQEKFNKCKTFMFWVMEEIWQ